MQYPPSWEAHKQRTCSAGSKQISKTLRTQKQNQTNQQTLRRVKKLQHDLPQINSTSHLCRRPGSKRASPLKPTPSYLLCTSSARWHAIAFKPPNRAWWLSGVCGTWLFEFLPVQVKMYCKKEEWESPSFPSFLFSCDWWPLECGGLTSKTQFPLTGNGIGDCLFLFFFFFSFPSLDSEFFPVHMKDTHRHVGFHSWRFLFAQKLLSLCYL